MARYSVSFASCPFPNIHSYSHYPFCDADACAGVTKWIMARSPTAPDLEFKNGNSSPYFLLLPFAPFGGFCLTPGLAPGLAARFSAPFGMTDFALSSGLTMGIIPVSTLFLVIVRSLIVATSPDLFNSDADDANARRVARVEADVTCAAALVGDPNRSRLFDTGAAQAERLGYAGRCAKGNPGLFVADGPFCAASCRGVALLPDRSAECRPA